MTEAPETRVTPEREAAIREQHAEAVRVGCGKLQSVAAIRDLLALLAAERARVAELQQQLDDIESAAEDHRWD